MKAIICAEHGQIHIHTFGQSWTPCECGNVFAKWLDPDAGTVVVAARVKERVRLLGLNNRYLEAALLGRNLSWERFRELHDMATEAPNFLFDKSRIACWAAVVEVGRSNDVRWANVDEFKEAFGY